MKQHFLFTIFLTFLVVFLSFPPVFSYESEPTHSALTRKTAELYNQGNSAVLSAEDINALIDGSIKEAINTQTLCHLYLG